MPAGRPTDYKPEYCELAENYLSQGKSIVQLATYLKVHKDTIFEWAKVHPEFSDSLSIGKQGSQAIWESRLEEMMYDKNVNSPLVKLYFANRFNWHDKQVVDQNVQGNVIIQVGHKTAEEIEEIYEETT